jgi:hypothetical protein
VHGTSALNEWGIEGNLLMHFFDNPRDAYSLNITDVKCCAHSELLTARKSYRRGPRNYADKMPVGSLPDAVVRGDIEDAGINITRPLFDGAWHGTAGDVKLESSTDPDVPRPRATASSALQEWGLPSS